MMHLGIKNKRVYFILHSVFNVFLSLISKHEMLRRMLMMNDGSLLTIMHQQHHAQILLKIEIKERVFLVFV